MFSFLQGKVYDWHMVKCTFSTIMRLVFNGYIWHEKQCILLISDIIEFQLSKFILHTGVPFLLSKTIPIHLKLNVIDNIIK